MAMITICPETLPIGWLSITQEGWIEAYNQQAQSCELWYQPLMVGGSTHVRSTQSNLL
ncbi:hypothetical protein QX226_01035 [Vibrio vulnificus]|uniref:hypothetical protein n=1 Tax=Vibrio vulnificus TaxID=672 RepID=UPI00287B0E1F|nr:hypothetical protein [Vibrio vulnificus]MDS1769907.1 hypothetical protein [Vibrio vulnificus]MDS1851574.1 hypothetical protein [Vibrio vulnificus]